MINFIMILQSRVASITISVQVWHIVVFTILILGVLAWAWWDVRHYEEWEDVSDD